MAVKKFRKHSGFVIYLYFQDIVLTAVNRDANVLTTYVKKRGTIFQLKVHERGTFYVKTGV